MIFIGDVHGHFGAYKNLIERAKDTPTFQLGDMGIGFGEELPSAEAHHKFIRGNHDSPSVCKEHFNYASDFGFYEKESLFFMGGAWSIDWQMRTPGVSWWFDEQLNPDELDAAYALYTQSKPKYMVSHDAPSQVGSEILKKIMLTRNTGKIKTRTDAALQRMFDFHKPDIWLFGHYHLSWNKKIKGTHFRCLNELETFEIEL